MKQLMERLLTTKINNPVNTIKKLINENYEFEELMESLDEVLISYDIVSESTNELIDNIKIFKC